MDLSVLDKKIRQLTRLRELLADEETRELLADPDVLQMAREIAAGNGSGVRQISVEQAARAVAPSVNDSLPPEGSFVRTVFDVARDSGATRFTSRYIYQKLLTRKYEFRAKDPMISINQALKSLLQARLITLVQQGVGRAPSIYANSSQQGGEQ